MRPARAVRWNGSHVSFEALGLPNAPSSLTDFFTDAVASSSSFASRNVPRRPISLSPRSAPDSAESSPVCARRSEAWRTCDVRAPRRARGGARGATEGTPIVEAMARDMAREVCADDVAKNR
jgi:hypothetical protein